jgi:MraZ protein
MPQKVVFYPKRERMATELSQPKMRGRFDHSLDEKARVIMPQKFREPLGKEFILALGPGDQIRAYPLAYWEEMEALVQSGDPRNAFKSDVNALERILGDCEEASLDQQNRLTIPRQYRAKTGLNENTPAVFIGCMNRVEIWSPAKWDAYRAQLDAASVDSILKSVQGDEAAATL